MTTIKDSMTDNDINDQEHNGIDCEQPTEARALQVRTAEIRDELTTLDSQLPAELNVSGAIEDIEKTADGLVRLEDTTANDN